MTETTTWQLLVSRQASGRAAARRLTRVMADRASAAAFAVLVVASVIACAVTGWTYLDRSDVGDRAPPHRLSGCEAGCSVRGSGYLQRRQFGDNGLHDPVSGRAGRPASRAKVLP
jgi:hypothetical protein